VIVLGIDPGTAAMGWGIIDRTGGTLRLIDVGCLQTSPDLGLPDRLLAIHRFLGELIERHDPSIVAVERLFFSRNAQTAFAVGQARGVVLLAAAETGRVIREATPSEVKVAVTGSGTADKEQVGRMVAVLLGLREAPRPDDAADALAPLRQPRCPVHAHSLPASRSSCRSTARSSAIRSASITRASSSRAASRRRRAASVSRAQSVRCRRAW